MRGVEEVAQAIFSDAIRWKPETKLLAHANVNAWELALIASYMIKLCPTCDHPPGNRPDCDTCVLILGLWSDARKEREANG